MTPVAILPFAAAGISVALAMVVLSRDRRSFSNRVFIVGMLALAARELAHARVSEVLPASELLGWYRVRLSFEALLPGIWLLFSLSFARKNYREFLRKWRWAIAAVFTIPLLLVGVWGDALLAEAVLVDQPRSVLPLGWSGYLLHILILLGAVLVLMNLESTLRASTGTIRWQIKFILLGLGALFATEIYTSSQTLLYSSIDTTLSLVSSASLLVADALILAWFLRKTEKDGHPPRRWNNGKICSYCSRRGFHETLCRNPWSVEK